MSNNLPTIQQMAKPLNDLADPHLMGQVFLEFIVTVLFITADPQGNWEQLKQKIDDHMESKKETIQ